MAQAAARQKGWAYVVDVVPQDEFNLPRHDCLPGHAGLGHVTRQRNHDLRSADVNRLINGKLAKRATAHGKYGKQGNHCTVALVLHPRERRTRIIRNGRCKTQTSVEQDAAGQDASISCVLGLRGPQCA